ncbi:hypothetical protein BDN72DRAFT_901142 [Pluteus cervinus]|uniref:Uncharacterized protein n=1 Tax=Pluteus cervinus TaxID=181527 RepID=A0ACD3AHN1_9AGAR|nr:hypothetical protein BDN72DRAFT_901142 [Pluteus cervinus]
MVGNLTPSLNGTTSPVSRYPSSLEAPPIVNPAQQELAPPPPSMSFAYYPGFASTKGLEPKGLNIHRLELHIAIEIFKQVVIPSSAHLSIEVTADGDEHRLINLLTTSGRIQHHRIISVEMNYDGWDDSYSVIVNSSANISDDSLLKFTLSISPPWPSLSRQVLDLPLHDVQCLSVNIPEYIPLESHMTIISSFPNVQGLCLHSARTTRAFIDLLDSTPTDTQSFPLPNLCDLTFCDTSDSLHVFTEAIILKFCNAFTIRCDSGTVLKRGWKYRRVYVIPRNGTTSTSWTNYAM